MSITLEIRGRSSSQWTLSTSCIDQIEMLRARPELSDDINAILGDGDLEAGMSREVATNAILEASVRLAAIAKSLAGSFVLDLPPLVISGTEIPLNGARAAGVTINGKPHLLGCYGSYWTLQPNDEFLSGKTPELRYEAAELFDEARGVPVKVVRRPSGGSELAKLLRKIGRFAENEVAATVQVTWG